MQMLDGRDYVWPNQDILNILYKEKIELLDYKWNIRPSLPSIRAYIEYAPIEERTAYYNAKKDPVLIHYTDQPKPWFCPDVEYGAVWWQVAMQTPFVGAISARMTDCMIHRNEYYANNKYNRVPELWSRNPLKLDPHRHFKKH